MEIEDRNAEDLRDVINSQQEVEEFI